MNTFIFDIETGPLPEAELDFMLPPFDPAEVKMGNLKDPDKIALKLAEAETNHRRDFINKAALDPLTGRVLAIGAKVIGAGEVSIISGDESDILASFWNLVQPDDDSLRINRMVGFNTHLFDLPFLIRRSWKHKLTVPWGVRKGKWWGEEMVDLRNEWQLGDRMAKGSLNAICRHLGLGSKSGDGKNFSDLWAADRKAAEEYLRNDIALTESLAQRIWLSSK